MLRSLYKSPYYNSIPADDFRGKQRYILFAALSVMAFLTGIIFFVETFMIFKVSGWIPYTMPAMSIAAVINFYGFHRHKNPRLAYAITIGACFLVLHLTSYTFGGLYSSSNFYLSVLTISTFILLGIRAGWIFTGISFAHACLMYYLTLYTPYIQNYDSNIPGAFEMDLVISLILSIALVALHCVSLEKAKEHILAEMDESHVNLKLYTRSIEKTNKELDSFAYIVSHDLKAPLRAIHNLTEWIEDDLKDVLAGESKDNFEMLRNRVARMDSLITRRWCCLQTELGLVRFG